MKVSICIYEDDFFKNFYPLTYSRPVFNLLSGAFTLAEKISNQYKSADINYLCRPIFELNEFENSNDYQSILFINGRLIAPNDLNEIIPLTGENEIFVNGDDIIAVRVNEDLLSKMDFDDPMFLSDLKIEKITEVNVTLAEYIWDLIKLNEQEIVKDFANLKTRIYTLDDYPENISLLNRDNILIGENSNIYPFTCIDAKNGPVIIGNNVTIYSNTYIQGPAYIGDNSVIKAGAKIYHNCSIGKVCKIGGEVENSIISDYSNKQHDGFLGHSYIGSWVNLGAGTNNSDLKNNYSKIKFEFNGELIETGMRFFGTLIGDHSKTAINTAINTATVIGFSCNLFGGNVFSKKIYPSFSWGDADKVSEYDLEKSKSVARTIMARRDRVFDMIDENVFNQIFLATQEDRKRN